MGGEPDGAAEPSSGNLATVHVRCSNGNKFSLAVDLASTVGALKGILVERSEIPADQQRLIYKGRVLKDDNSLDSYGLQNDHTVHLVRGAPSSTAPAAGAPAATTGRTSVPAPTAPAANPPGAGVAAGLGGLTFPNLGGIGTGGAAGAGAGFGMGLSDFQQVQQQLMQNPNLMREMMNLPAVQNLMNNPDLMRTLIMSNPQMRDIIDRNPDLAHILNDPGTLRQTLDAARNPELMREMMRNTDRAMSNIEASPEGFNMLRRMYETVQEPLLNAATMGGEGGNDDLASNPFAALLGPQGLAQAQGAPGSTAPTNAAASGVGAGATVPNTAPLPNPWNPSPAATATGPGAGNGVAAGQTPSGTLPTTLGSGGLPMLGRFPGMNLPELGALNSGGLLDPNTIRQMLQNPDIQQMMQGLLANPQYMEQGLMQLQQIMGQQQPGQIPGQTGAATGGNPNLDINSLLNMFGGLGSNVPSTIPEVNTVPPEQLYAAQLVQLQEMGFFDTTENIRALSAVGGNVHAAVERLLGNPG